MSNNVTELGGLDSWSEAGKRFIEKDLASQFAGVSVNSTEPGEGSASWHKHSRLEELYIVLDGRGEIALDDEVIALQPGTVARAGQDVWRALRCLPDSEAPLRWLCVRAGGDALEDIGADWEIDKERPFPWSA